jgi:hypothetical protein
LFRVLFSKVPLVKQVQANCLPPIMLSLMSNLLPHPVSPSSFVSIELPFSSILQRDRFIVELSTPARRICD